MMRVTLKERIDSHLTEYNHLVQELLRDLQKVSDGSGKAESVIQTTKAIVELQGKFNSAIDDRIPSPPLPACCHWP